MTQSRRRIPSSSLRYLTLLLSCIAIITTTTLTTAKIDEEFTSLPLPDISSDLDRVTTTTPSPTTAQPTPPQPGPDTNYIEYGTLSFCQNSIPNTDNTICCSNQCNGKCGGTDCCSHGAGGCNGCCAGRIQTAGRVCEDFYDMECVIPQLETGVPSKEPSTDAPVVTPLPTKIPPNERK